ncbi:hypothetical protein THAOC_06836, partial [Thalassiosira oceanica]
LLVSELKPIGDFVGTLLLCSAVHRDPVRADPGDRRLDLARADLQGVQGPGDGPAAPEPASRACLPPPAHEAAVPPHPARGGVRRGDAGGHAAGAREEAPPQGAAVARRGRGRGRRRDGRRGAAEGCQEDPRPAAQGVAREGGQGSGDLAQPKPEQLVAPMVSKRIVPPRKTCPSFSPGHSSSILRVTNEASSPGQVSPHLGHVPHVLLGGEHDHRIAHRQHVAHELSVVLRGVPRRGFEVGRYHGMRRCDGVNIGGFPSSHRRHVRVAAYRPAGPQQKDENRRA